MGDKKAIKKIEKERNSPKEYKCKCEKSYSNQGGLFNHIRDKHDNNKEEFVIKRGVNPGRPRKETKTNLPSLTPAKITEIIIISFKEELRNLDSQTPTKIVYKKFMAELTKLKNILKLDNFQILEQQSKFLKSIGSYFKESSIYNIFINFAFAFLESFFKLTSDQLSIIRNYSHFNQKFNSRFLTIFQDPEDLENANSSQDEDNPQESFQQGGQDHSADNDFIVPLTNSLGFQQQQNCFPAQSPGSEKPEVNPQPTVKIQVSDLYEKEDPQPIFYRNQINPFSLLTSNIFIQNSNIHSFPQMFTTYSGFNHQQNPNSFKLISELNSNLPNKSDSENGDDSEDDDDNCNQFEEKEGDKKQEDQQYNIDCL